MIYVSFSVEMHDLSLAFLQAQLKNHEVDDHCLNKLANGMVPKMLMIDKIKQNEKLQSDIKVLEEENRRLLHKVAGADTDVINKNHVLLRDMERLKDSFAILENSVKAKEVQLKDQADCISKLIDVNHQLTLKDLPNKELTNIHENEEIMELEAEIAAKDRELEKLTQQLNQAEDSIEMLNLREKEYRNLLQLSDMVELTVSTVSDAVDKLICKHKELRDELHVKERKVKSLIKEKQQLLEKIKQLKHQIGKNQFSRKQLESERKQQARKLQTWDAISQGEFLMRQQRGEQNGVKTAAALAQVTPQLPPYSQKLDLSTTKKFLPSIDGKYCILCRSSLPTMGKKMCQFHTTAYHAPKWSCCNRPLKAPGCLTTTHFYIEEVWEGKILTNGNTSIIL